MKSKLSALLLAAILAGCSFPAQHARNAVSLERQAETALAEGKPEEALAIYERAAERWRKAGRHKIFAATLDSIARIHKDQGDFDEAVDSWLQALSVAEAIEETDTVLRTLGNLGLVHSMWGRYGKALGYYERALELAKTLKHAASIARIHNNIGAVYRNQGKLDQALEHYEKALAIDRRRQDDTAVAARLANIGTVHMDRGDYDRARDHYRRALATAKKHGRKGKMATRLNNLGAVSVSLGDFEQALRYYRRALKLHTELKRRQAMATVASNMGSAYWYLERYEKAEKRLLQSIRLKDELRRGATGEIRRDYLASQIETYEWLTATYVRADQPREALLSADSSRAQYLIDQLREAGSEERVGDSRALDERFLQRLPKNVAIVYFANVGWNRMIRLVATSDGVVASELDTGALLGKLGTANGDVSSLEGYRSALAEAVGSYRELLISTDAEDSAERDRQGRLLHDALLDGALVRRHLVVVPDGSLAFLPFEALKGEDGRYLIERHLVTYTPSLAVSEVIHRRRQSRGERTLLALGDAKYEGDALRRRLDELSLEQIGRRGRRRLDRDLVLTDTYDELGYRDWARLPGTREEAVGIAHTIPEAHALLGGEVNEAKIKAMSRAGDLAKYRMLHFATHGIAFPETPSLSALVLSQTNNQESGEDGFLTMREIAQLKLDADQVVLSACDTGLGKLYAGEGVVGLAQAFFVSGARAVAVSLWKVSDDSTAELMLRSYEIMQERGISFAAAIAEAKRSFIAKEAKEPRFAAPYHWAAFTHYGAWDVTAARRRSPRGEPR